jgi:hypothetical protein
MQQKKLILFIIILFIISSAYLLAVGLKFESLNFGQNWWTVYFASPKSNDFNFVIENHSDSTNFHWIILTDKEKIKEGDVKVESGKMENIKPAGINATGKVIIEVSAGDEKKEIYKNF